ncbi:lipopolysaccharide biosynthesis protein [Rhodococcus sp. SORGH_AS_0301]|uniref:lipopolysaccharide biosynthesis protein n=1 Tax=Rhodococcus sp. SORGH_AS_0301 TaxID=3041780 RepID=UPI002788A3B1|nr:hypothetical protein [Rhodococcus sp. SORGH_AS_0301]MDQ1181966.1 O-antigen/teichoic acid export membrane protein [Rhodococcus sp. SORGH_AS_0301]
MTSARSGTGSAGLLESERRSLFYSTGFRIAGTPVIAVCGLVSTAIVVRSTGEAVYGLVSLITTVGLLLPFADLGIGAVVTTAVSKSTNLPDDAHAHAVVRRAYSVLALIAVGLTLLACVIAALDAWGSLLGIRTGPQDRWAITVAVIVWAWTIPAALNLRLLIGSGRNHHSVVVTMCMSVSGLLLVATAHAAGVRGIWFVVPPLLGAFLVNVAGTVWVFRLLGRRSILGIGAEDRSTRRPSTRALLQGSFWLFVISVGVPFGLQSQRVVLAHLSTPMELSAYALAAQLYGVVWAVFSTAGAALWPIFASRTAVPELVALWKKCVALFAVSAVLASVPFVALAPFAARVLSGSEIEVSAGLATAFAILLVVQVAHLPTGVLLIQATEARWQAWCLVAMAVTTSAAAILIAPSGGAPAVVIVTAVSVCVCQLLPGLGRAPALLARRPEVV